MEPGNGVNATDSYLFSATLAFSDDPRDAVATNRTAAVEVQFYLFREQTAIAIGNNLTLHAEPSFAKFSVRLFDWPWRGGVNNTLEMRIKLAPAFTNFSRRANPGEIVTSLTLEGQFSASSKAVTEIRLVRAVEVDNEVDPQGARFDVDVAASELVLTFPRFNSTLVYDPGKRNPSMTHVFSILLRVTDPLVGVPHPQSRLGCAVPGGKSRLRKRWVACGGDHRSERGRRCGDCGGACRGGWQHSRDRVDEKEGGCPEDVGRAGQLRIRRPGRSCL